MFEGSVLDFFQIKIDIVIAIVGIVPTNCSVCVKCIEDKIQFLTSSASASLCGLFGWLVCIVVGS